MKKVKLPDFSIFESKVKKENPYDKFYLWVVSQVFPLGELLYNSPSYPNKNIDVSRVGLTEEDGNKLKEITVKWAKTAYKIGIKRAEQEISWLDLNIGPRILLKEDHPDFKSGYVYLNEPIFRNKNE